MGTVNLEAKFIVLHSDKVAKKVSSLFRVLCAALCEFFESASSCEKFITSIHAILISNLKFL